MLREWGNNVAVEEPHEEIAADPRESKFELPPIEHAPHATEAEKSQALRRVIEQAERERAAAAAKAARDEGL